MRVRERGIVSKCQAMMTVLINVQIIGNMVFLQRHGEH